MVCFAGCDTCWGGVCAWRAVTNQQVVTTTPFTWTGVQLPPNISLSNSGTERIAYVLTLTVHTDLEAFNGTGTIDFTTTSAMSGLVLHGRGLQVTRGQLWVSSTESWEAKTIGYDSDREYVFLSYSKDLPKGKLQIYLEWNGVVGNGTEGLYKSEFVDETNPTGPKKALLATQFEPNYARRVFPCFDDPAYRAFWELDINVPSSLTTSSMGLSNMPLDVDPPQQSLGMTSFSFAQAPNAIPAYLVAFVIGDMQYIETQWGTVTSSPLRVYFTRPSQAPFAAFALQTAQKFMNYYEDLTRLPYPFPKLDLVAIPDFAAGAMENPGVITFRETALLVDNATMPSFASSMRVAEVIAHELAHQWYGNTLEPVWWNDLWIAEGSATYWSYVALDTIFPEWAYTKNFFLSNEWDPAMQADELAATSAVYRNVTTVEDARDIFDVTTYAKGASIIRHINQQLMSGELSSTMSLWFRRNLDGLSMNSTTYLATMTADASRPSTGPDASPFIFHASFPVVNFSYPDNTSTTKLVATMQSYSSFYYQLADDTTAPWTIPLLVTSGASSTTTNFGSLTAHSRNITVSLNLNQNVWYKANPDGLSYYRTQYPITNWRRLINGVAANDSRLSSQDRAVLITDALAWAEIGQLPYSLVFDLLNASLSPLEKNHAVWKAALTDLDIIDDLLQDESCFGNFETMMSAFLSPAFNYWTWDITTTSDPVNTSIVNAVVPTASDVNTRTLILSAGADYITSSSFTTDAITAVNNYLLDPVNNALPPDTSAALLKVAVIHGNFKLWERLWTRYTQSSDASERSRLLVALAWTQLEYKASALLTYLLDPTLIRSQDHASVLRTMANNHHTGANIIWPFFQQQHHLIYARFPQNIHHWVATLTKFTEAYRITEITEFFANNPELEVDVAPILEVINDNVEWLEDYGPQLCTTLVASYPGTKRASTAPRKRASSTQQ